MCGLAGEYATRRSPDRGAVERMAATMTDRGPDGAGAWSQGPVALAHRRLKVIDLSSKGDQPMVDAQLGLTIVFNGCIYNYRELRRELVARGPPLRVDERQRGHLEGPRPVGPSLRRSASPGCSRSRSMSTTPAASSSRATGSASSRSISPRSPAERCGSPRRCGPARRWRVQHRPRPDRAATST